ncbi:MAG: hypothetical protein Q8K55_15465 [Gemmatimonadaceae bacterium]|nr:hypothetical protein [Gemmatimonadaceae bacterium]
MTDDLDRPQSAMERYFFTPLYYPLSPFQVVGWWERRRLVYNVCVGSAGVLSLGVLMLLHPQRSAMADFGLVVGVGLYGLAANACFSLGWMADLALRRILGIRAPDLAPVLLRYGFVFSLGLTLLPIPVAVAGRVLLAIMGVPTAR